MKVQEVFARILGVFILFHTYQIGQSQKFTKQDVLNYLRRYGHIQHSNALVDGVDDMSYATALRSLQRYGGIKQTGILDEATKKLMQTPRLGVPDIRRTHKTKSSSSSKRRKSYVLSPEVNRCANNPCQNGGWCLQSDSSYICFCPDGWTGDNCETAWVNPCTNNPCKNGGTCNRHGAYYTCSCASGWIGENCTTVNRCANKPCQNGGKCLQSDSSYTCFCRSGWTGNNCETAQVNPCTNNPCQNGGTCNRYGSSYTCSCASGWTGRNCATEF